MRKPKLITVSKIDAAQRQVDTAIKLWFADGDPVSIHTLLYAAVDIVHGLHGRATGKRLFFENDAMKSIPGMVQIVKDWPNFFKHGRRHELDRVLSFNPGANLVLFSACIAGLARIGAPQNDLHDALTSWLLIHEPAFFSAFVRKQRPSGETLRQIRRISKKKFLEDHLRIARKRRR
jgi:hypothetical protein